MLALNIIQPNKVIYTEVESPLIDSNSVKIKIKSSTICGSDLNYINNPQTLPQIPGHEFSGVVIEVGDCCSQNIKPGDIVTAFPMIGCMNCEYCKEKDYRECNYKKSIGFDLPGSFAEEIVVDQQFIVPINRGITFDQISLVEHLSCSYRLSMEVIDALKTNYHYPILIIGDGPMALANVQMLIHFGYKNITMIGKHKDKLTFAEKLGVKKIFKYNNLTELSPLDKFKVCIHSVRSDNTLESVLCHLDPNAYIFLQARIMNLPFKLSLIKSNFIFGRAFAYYLDDFNKVIDLIADGFIDTDSLISERVSLKKAANILSGNYNKKNIKVVISI